MDVYCALCAQLQTAERYIEDRMVEANNLRCMAEVMPEVTLDERAMLVWYEREMELMDDLDQLHQRHAGSGHPTGDTKAYALQLVEYFRVKRRSMELAIELIDMAHRFYLEVAEAV